MPVPLEMYRTYNYPSYACFSALHDHVIENLNIELRGGFGSIKTPVFARYNLKVIEAEPRVGFMKAQPQAKVFKVLQSTIHTSPVIKIVCEATGTNSCGVAISSDSATYSNSRIANITYGLTSNIPIISSRSTVPKTYFDDVVVYDKDNYGKVEEYYKRAYKYIFSKVHKSLDEYLRKKYQG